MTAQPIPAPTYDLAHFSQRIVRAALRGQARTADDADLKACVMIAREHGHLTDEETEFYIAAWGLIDA